MYRLIADFTYACTQDVQTAPFSVLSFNRVHLQLFTMFTEYTFLGTLIMKSKLINVIGGGGGGLLCILQETEQFFKVFHSILMNQF